MIDLMADLNLWKDAVCATIDPEIWFDPKDEHTARAICNACPLKELCTDYAVKNNIEHGIWGGTNPQERVELVKNHKKALKLAQYRKWRERQKNKNGSTNS